MSMHSQSSTVYPPPYMVFDLQGHDFRHEPLVSQPSQHHFWSTSVEVPRDNARRSDLAILPTLRSHHEHHSVPYYALHANPVYPALSVPTQVNQQSHHLALWRSVDTQVFSDTSYDRTSTPHPAFMLGQHGTCWDTHAAYDPSSTPQPDSFDQVALSHLVEQDIDPYNFGNHLVEEPSVHSRLSHATFSRYPGTPSGDQKQNITESFTVLFPPSPPQLLTLSLAYPPPYPTSIRHVELEPRFRLVSPQDPSAPSRHYRDARAIEYAGLWLDKEELLQCIAEHNGKLDVHQCLWEADHSPCRFWIKCDKSSISTHLQRWHGVKPGGDKVEVACRWSTCGRTMLKESIARHILNIHVGESWKCQACGKSITRKDVYGRHVTRSKFSRCRTAGAQITYSADVRTIDARVALASGERLLYLDE